MSYHAKENNTKPDKKTLNICIAELVLHGITTVAYTKILSSVPHLVLLLLGWGPLGAVDGVGSEDGQPHGVQHGGRVSARAVRSQSNLNKIL